ncbi:MAG: type IV secretion system protein [Rickettsiaceae bacterium]
MHLNAYADADNSRFDWMNLKLSNITSAIPSCIEVPRFASMHEQSTALNLDDNNQWRPTGAYVSEGKLLQMEWSSRGIQIRPSKYKVMYRIDPRFAVPQIFIQKYNYDSKKYISDFHQFHSGALLRYQNVPEMTLHQRLIDFDNYFQFQGRPKIPVKKNDVINITLDNSGEYFSADSEMNQELGSLDDFRVIYTDTSLSENRLIYTSAQQFCQEGIKDNGLAYTMSCAAYGDQLYWDVGYNLKTFTGRIQNRDFNINKQNISRCADSDQGLDSNALCYYDLGRGFEITVGGTRIKGLTEKFVHSPFLSKDFLYYKSDIDGDLDFQTSWPIEGMYNGPQLMKDWWQDIIKGNPDPFTYAVLFNKIKPQLTMNFLHFGRYLMNIEIGNSAAMVTKEDVDAINVEYIIMSENTRPDKTTSGTTMDRYYRGNASKTGYLFVRVNRPNNEQLTGTVQVKTANYTGSTWFSDVVYGDIVKPLRATFNKLSKIIYMKFITNATLQNIAYAMVTIYIILYGLLFLAGATQITVTDIVLRVLKIGVIFALFSKTSWTFFNTYLFNVFMGGADSLMAAVIGVSSQAGNIFGFIDPIFDKYTNGTIWGLLFIQLLQIHTGMTFFAIITIYAIIIYCRAILEVIVSYCLAFLGLAVMISLAPFFIILILFERTKSMFDNWISVMFSYMIQPTILLIFFLLIDQIMGDHIARTVIRSCWDTLIPLKIGLDLNNLGIPISFSFSLPFLPGIPFYVPQPSVVHHIEDFFSKTGTLAMLATSTLLFFALSKLASGLVTYVTLVVQYLTNVMAARQDGRLQKGLNPIQDITGDISKLASPVTVPAKKLGKFIREKAIDQKIKHRGKSTQRDIDYNKFGNSQTQTNEETNEEQNQGPLNNANESVKNLQNNTRDKNLVDKVLTSATSSTGNTLKENASRTFRKTGLQRPTNSNQNNDANTEKPVSNNQNTGSTEPSVKADSSKARPIVREKPAATTTVQGKYREKLKEDSEA